MAKERENNEKQFDQFDKKHEDDGKLTFSETHQFLDEQLKHKTTIVSIKNLFEEMGKTIHDCITKKEWLDYLDKHPLKDIGMDDLTHSFHGFDRDGNGVLSRYEAKEVMKIKYPDMGLDKIEELVTGFDKNKDGIINIHEFVHGVYENGKA